jgi:S1-C subfamily serine protease
MCLRDIHRTLFPAAIAASIGLLMLTSHAATAVGQLLIPPRFEDELPAKDLVRRSVPLNANPAPVPIPEDEFLTAEERVNIAVYDTTHRSVVHIDTRAVQTDSFWGDSTTSEGSGSGSIWDELGHILTNYHVIEGSQQLVVTMHDGNQYEAKKIGADPPNDIAILKVDAPHQSLQPVRIGDSDRLRVGQRVYAFGSPFGLERTMTSGIISSLNRTLPSRNHRTMKAIIQVDAALNRGNSGGPLMSSRGELVGMNTAIASGTGENTGIGFAIPASTIRRIVPQLIATGHVVRPTIGVEAVAEIQQGLLVAKLTAGGPAEKAGLKAVQIVSRRRIYGLEKRLDISSADIIIGAAGKPVRSADDLLSIVEQGRAGDSLELNIVRQGNRLRLTVVLADET